LPSLERTFKSASLKPVALRSGIQARLQWAVKLSIDPAGSCGALPAKQSAKEAQEGDADAGKAADEPEPHD
jgi:hypothetical protein